MFKTVKNILAKDKISVHIVTSDNGWILERLAREISGRLPYVTYGTAPDSTALIQYYMTYGCRDRRVSPIEIALFTHREEDATAAARFDAAAQDVDHAVAMSSTTLQIVNALGVSSSSCIMPGVDIEAFRPKLKIAVVGRTYHTGRKGEALVRAVMDVPDIEWHFTGAGWPGPAEHVPDADLPAFYRSMDYILVPALNEGGPMSVLEALASGVEVIASAVGWVPDFPHIPFKRGDAASLREVLMRLRDERLKRRSSVEHITWDRWASEHDALFRRLASLRGEARLSTPVSEQKQRLVQKVALVTHGIEDTTLGGPSRRVPATAQALQNLSVSATASHDREQDMGSADIIHGFNIWQPKTALRVAREAKRLNKPLVFSPIVLDLSEAPLWQADVFRVFRGASSGREAEALMEHYTQLQRERSVLHPSIDPEPGYRDMLREIAELADGLIYLSERERAIFNDLVGVVDTPGYLVRNPVDATYFRAADRDLFRQTYGLDDYIVCVARVEPRKNQLMLVNALRDSGLPIVLIGHEAHPEYAALVKRYGGPNVIMIDRLEPNSELLRSAIAGARVFVLPSWAEGAPLTALEAAATGANMVLSNRSGEREYIGDYARYCDPSDAKSVRKAVLEAWEAPLAPNEARALADHVTNQFSWAKHAQDTLDVYEDVLGRLSAKLKPKVAGSGLPQHIASSVRDIVIFDVTTWANNANILSGIVRVERSIAMELINRDDISSIFVMYYSGQVGFVELPRDVIIRDILGSYVLHLKAQNLAKPVELDLPAGGELIAVGSSWMQNSDYAAELAQLARQHELTLSVLMHDMTPALFPHWYDEGYSASWERNCATMLAHANRLLVYSDSTRKDVASFAEKYKISMPFVAKIRLADEVGTLESTPTIEGVRAQEIFRNRPYVLAVGGIHLRKNYGLLYDTWLILRETMGDNCPHLVIVGGVSWNGTETARVMRGDPKVNSHIHILENIDDGTLDWLYDHALMTAYPSLYEGWGLPVGESLAHGKICLSSDSSSMKEIAPEITDLINPFDRIRWASMIQHYATSSSSRMTREAEIREKFAITSWRHTADNIVEALSCESTTRPAPIYNLGDIALAGAEGEGGAYLASGWFSAEEWGRWAKSRTPMIELELAHIPDEDVVLTLLARVLKPTHEALHYDVRVNGRSVGSWHFPPRTDGPIDFDTLLNRVVIPRDTIGTTGKLRIELVGDRICAVCEVTPDSADPRRLGLGLSAFMIECQSLASDAAVLFSTRPDVRAALGVAPTVDLPTMLTETAHRPSIVPDTAIRRFRPFCQVGVPDDLEGVAADSGCLTFAFGITRLRLDRAANVQFVIDAPHASADRPVIITIFANDLCLQTINLETYDPTMVEFAIPQSLLASSEPLNLSFFGAGAKKAGVTEFFVSMIRFTQGMLLPSEQRTMLAPDQSLLLGLTHNRQPAPPHMLAGGWSALEEDGIWSLGATGRLRFAIAPEMINDAVLLLDIGRIASGREDDTITIFAADDSKIAEFDFSFAIGLHRRIAIPLHAAANSSGEIDIRLVPNNQSWPSRHTSHPDPRRLGVRLSEMSVHVLPNDLDEMPACPSAPMSESILTLDGWHDWEPEGRWTAEPSATFVFRTPKAGLTPIIHGDMLVSTEGDVGELSLCYSLNAGSTELVRIRPRDAAAIALPLSNATDPGIYMVTLSGIELVTPMSLGINEDVRPVGFRLRSLSFVSGEEEGDYMPDDQRIPIA